MAEITAAAVKALRDKTQLPMMECKRALESTAGDMEKAIEKLRLEGKKTMAARADRETTAGRIAVYADDKRGAMPDPAGDDAVGYRLADLLSTALQW